MGPRLLPDAFDSEMLLGSGLIDSRAASASIAYSHVGLCVGTCVLAGIPPPTRNKVQTTTVDGNP